MIVQAGKDFWRSSSLVSAEGKDNLEVIAGYSALLRAVKFLKSPTMKVRYLSGSLFLGITMLAVKTSFFLRPARISFEEVAFCPCSEEGPLRQMWLSFLYKPPLGRGHLCPFLFSNTVSSNRFVLSGDFCIISLVLQGSAPGIASR